MVKAEELRKGILINSKLLGSNHTVTGFISRNGRDFLYTDLQESYSDLEDWQGIALTSEILEDAGFANVHGSNYKKGPLFISNWADKGLIFWPDETKDDEVREIASVHQLQNLYFALTGEELTIKISETKEAV